MIIEKVCSNGQSRIVLIDLMQGLAMIIVIVGHHLFPFLAIWYNDMHSYIYLFHMPFFILISGFLIRYSYKGVDNIKGYWHYIFRKGKKFVPPYVIIGLLAIILKGPESFERSLTLAVNLLINPIASEATFLWYIYLLFLLYILSPIVFLLTFHGKIVLFAVSLLLWLYPANTNLLCLAYLCKLSPFYVTGVLLAEKWTIIMSKYCEWEKLSFAFMNVGLVSFVILSFFHFCIGKNYFIDYLIPWISLPALTYIAWLFGHFMKKALVFVSCNCFGIYLLHMFFVNAVALVLGRFSFWGTSVGTILYLIVSTSVSILFAALCWQYIGNINKLKEQVMELRGRIRI